MTNPWNTNREGEYTHNTYEEDGIVKCRDCGKVATNESKLTLTPCTE